MSVQVSYKKQILFGIVLLIVILAVLEGIVNIWWNEVINKCAYEENEFFKHLDEEVIRQLCVESYDLQYTDTRIFATHGLITINSHGFRGPEIAQEKPDNTYRIFVTGASTVFGSRVLDDETIPAYLQKKFDDDKLEFKVEVINAGIHAITSTQEAKLIKERLIDYEPDLIIAYDGWTDLIYTKDPIIWKDVWIEICNLGKEVGFETIVTLQPAVGTGNRILTEQEHHYLKENLEILEPYPLYIQQLDELNRHCTKTADLREIFDFIPEPIFYDRIHVGPRGNLFAADKIHEIALPVVLADNALFYTNSENSNNNLREKENNISVKLNSLEEPEFLIRKLISFYKTPRALSHFYNI